MIRRRQAAEDDGWPDEPPPWAAVADQGRGAEAATLATRATAILAARLPPGHPYLQAAAGVSERWGRPA